MARGRLLGKLMPLPSPLPHTLTMDIILELKWPFCYVIQIRRVKKEWKNLVFDGIIKWYNWCQQPLNSRPLILWGKPKTCWFWPLHLDFCCGWIEVEMVNKHNEMITRDPPPLFPLFKEIKFPTNNVGILACFKCESHGIFLGSVQSNNVKLPVLEKCFLISQLCETFLIFCLFSLGEWGWATERNWHTWKCFSSATFAIFR